MTSEAHAVTSSKHAAKQPRRVADRLALSDRAGFIGRTQECALFRTALAADHTPTVLHVHGPGGVGKTTLLREFARMAADAGRPVVALDARHMRPSKRGVLQAFGEALACEVQDAGRIPVPGRGVVIIDTCERLRALDPWLRDTVVPAFQEGVLVVLGGRDTPAREWYSDIAWSPLTWIIELQNFAPSESAAFLTSRGVAGAAHAAVLDFTHGHPLALSLVADVVSSNEGAGFDPVEAPDVVRHLLGLFIDAVPDEFRDALDVSAIARVTTARLLSDVLDSVEGRSAFEWLRAQECVESSAIGVFPHDLAREVLLADSRWRDPDRFRRLARRVYAALHAHIGNARGRERQRLQMDALYVTRTTPTNVSFFDWRALDDVYLEPAEPDEGEWILELVHKHEGAASAALAHRWWRAQPEAFHVCHDGQNRFGFVALVDIGNPAIAKELRDPAVEAAAKFVARHGPGRTGRGCGVPPLVDACGRVPGGHRGNQSGGDARGLALRDASTAGVELRGDERSGVLGRAFRWRELRPGAGGRLRGGRPALRRLRARMAHRPTGGLADGDAHGDAVWRATRPGVGAFRAR